jgi:ABC-2 type transport system ATP-binding protein
LISLDKILNYKDERFLIEKNNIRGSKKVFGEVTAIGGLNLSISEGEVYAFLGHNGAGKTTTLRLLPGLLEPNKGNITVFGNNPIKDGNAVRAMCGVLSEDVGLYGPLTVYDNLLYYADIYGMSRIDSNKLIDELLSRFELFDKKGLAIKGFSTGMNLRNMLSELAKEHGTTIIMTTHNLDEVQKMCVKISIFRHGRNLFTDSISTLKDSNHYAENGQFSLEKLYMDIEKKGTENE